jgi:glycerophosphoryl diester phosphodiesterase
MRSLNEKTPYGRLLCLVLLGLAGLAPSVPAQTVGTPATVNAPPPFLLPTPPKAAATLEAKSALAVSTASTPFADRPVLPGPKNSDAVLDWCYPGSSVTDFRHPDYAFGCAGAGFNQTHIWWLEDQYGNITRQVTDSYVNPRLLAWQQHTLLGRYTSGSNSAGNFTVPWFWYANTQVVGHRAERADMPENTLLALRYAMQRGVPVEMDLMIDDDGDLFFQHDGVYDFFFTGRSPECHNRYIPEMTRAERESCDVSEGKTPRSAGFVKMPELVDVLMEIQGYRPPVRDGMPAFFLELKAPIWIHRNLVYDKASLGQKAAEAVAANGLADRVWLSSLEATALAAAKAARPEVKTVTVDKPGILGGAIGANAIDAAVSAGHAGLMVDVTKLYDGSSSLYGRAVGRHDDWKNSVLWNNYVSFDNREYRSTPPAGDLTALTQQSEI